MTYNVHGCCGRDRKALPSVIAEVIAINKPDIVALQELDVGLPRSGFIDQAQAIAEQLQMNYHFSAALWLEQGQYGNAVLSKHPLSLKKAGGLPTLNYPATIEPRGVIWAEVTAGGQDIQVFNTHLGLRKRERMLQVDRLLGPEWLNHPDCRPPVILCGDMNALPTSSEIRRIGKKFLDAQLQRKTRRFQKTYPSRFPLVRIDYIFISGDIRVKSAVVPRSPLIRRASDHLPLVVGIIVPA